MPSRRFVWIYLAILILALSMRLFHVGMAPLSDDEADWALQAWELVQGRRPLLGPQAAYQGFTAGAFFLLGASNSAARLWPALMGTLLLLIPWLLCERLGERAALVLALGLAVDPGLWALSRLAGSPLPAVVLLALTVLLWLGRRYVLAGVCAGLALLTGPAVWFGALALGLLLALLSSSPGKTLFPGRHPTLDWASARQVWPWTLGALLLAGTLFGFVPSLLGAAAASLPHFLRGWWTPAGAPLWQALLALPAEETLPLLFGLIASVRGFVRRDRFTMTWSLLTLVAFLLILAYPGRQLGFLAWVILPLWVLAAREIGRYLDWRGIETGVVLPVMTFTLVLLMLVWFMLAYATLVWVEGGLFYQPTLRLAVGVLLFLIIGLALAWFSWEPVSVVRGGILGLVAALGIVMIGMGTYAAGLRHPPGVSLWTPSPVIRQADLLRRAVDQISDWKKGHTAMLTLRLADIDSPALRWLFRDYPVETLEAPNVSDQPDAILTPADSPLPQEAGYRGQDFLWRQIPRWENASTLDWLRWCLFRTIPEHSENIVLWVRQDLTFMEQENGHTQDYRD